MGVGDGGFSGMMPCLRRISFLQGHQTLPRIDMLFSLPLGVFIGVDLDLHRYIWHSRVHFGHDSGRAAACARGRMYYTVSCGGEWQVMRCMRPDELWLGRGQAAIALRGVVEVLWGLAERRAR